MTNEEIIDRLKVIIEINEVDPAMIDNGDVIALNKAIELVKREVLAEKMTRIYFEELRKEADNASNK